jgi:hypothetical protein
MLLPDAVVLLQLLLVTRWLQARRCSTPGWCLSVQGLVLLTWAVSCGCTTGVCESVFVRRQAQKHIVSCPAVSHSWLHQVVSWIACLCTACGVYCLHRVSFSHVYVLLLLLLPSADTVCTQSCE